MQAGLPRLARLAACWDLTFCNRALTVLLQQLLELDLLWDLLHKAHLLLLLVACLSRVRALALPFWSMMMTFWAVDQLETTLAWY